MTLPILCFLCKPKNTTNNYIHYNDVQVEDLQFTCTDSMLHGIIIKLPLMFISPVATALKRFSQPNLMIEPLNIFSCEYLVDAHPDAVFGNVLSFSKVDTRRFSRFWFLSHRRPSKAPASCAYAPSLLPYTKYGCI